MQHSSRKGESGDARYFSHSGDLGDIIYSLPAIRACGGGVLGLFDKPGRTAHGMTPERASKIIPLLKAQPYIVDAYFTTDPTDTSLNGFRDHFAAGNLADMHLATQGLGPEHRAAAWLTVEPMHIADVVIVRTGRYQNPYFPWGRVLEKYAGRMVFVGTEPEHRAFECSFGRVARVDLNDMLSVARVIAGAKLFIGNYTAATAIAEGLKHPSVVEVAIHNHTLAMFHRIGCVHGWNGAVELPEID